MNYDDKALAVLSQSIKKAVEHLLATASYDKTVQGKITEVLTGNYYKVQIHDGIYTIPSWSDMTYAVNENVWVTIIQNDFKNIVISGRRRK